MEFFALGFALGALIGLVLPRVAFWAREWWLDRVEYKRGYQAALRARGGG